MENINNVFISDMKNLEDLREIHLTRISDFILPVTNCYPNKLKESKENLKYYGEAKKNTEKLKKNRNPSQLDDINSNLGKSIREEEKMEKEVEKGIMTFESERCNDNKYLLLHFIHSELKYHADALEKLSKLFSKINEEDPTFDFEKFISEYKIDCDLKKIGIDLEKINKRKEEKENKKKEKVSEVYDDFEEENKSDKVKKSKNNMSNSHVSSENE